MSRILIIHPEGNLNNNPNLTGIVEILCENGYAVDIYSRKRTHLTQVAPCPTSRFITTSIADPTDTAVLFIPESVLSQEALSDLKNSFEQYDLVVGVDRGIIEACEIATLIGVPYGLISYEIYFGIETGQEFKKAEIQACRAVSFAVCQDKVRAACLAAENHIAREKIFDIPVAGRSTTPRKRTYALHEALGLGRDKKIALYIGEVNAKFACFEELFDSTATWDDSWVLVLHQRYGYIVSNIAEQIKASKNVYISPFPSLDLKDLYLLLDAADIGVACYLPQMDTPSFLERLNLKHIGMASGKIASYLQHGLPILINEIGEMSEHVREYNLGRVIDDFSNTGAILSSLNSNELDKSQVNCQNFFRHRLDLKLTIQPLLTVIDDLLNRKELFQSPNSQSKAEQNAFSTSPTQTSGFIGSHSIKLHAETVRYAKAWNSSGGATAALDDDQMSLVKVFQDLCSEYEQPFIIDVGAHVGTFALAVSLQPNLCGCAFEPLASVCEVLRENIALNDLENRWSVFQKALSNYPGRRVLKVPRQDKQSGLACIGQTNYAEYKEEYVDVARLDDVIGSAAIPSVDIISLDTGGSELFVLIGAAETINKYKPDLLISVNWSNLNQFDLYLNNLSDYLELIGYHGHWVGPETMVFRHPGRRSHHRKACFGHKPVTGDLKVAIVKQHYDLFGPWRSERWDAADPLSVLKKWPSRYLYFEMTHLLQADWYVLPFCHDSKNVRQRLDKHQQTLDDNMEPVRNVNDIPLEEYDLVISLDPILRPPRNSKTLYAYYQNEHHHTEYTHSLRAPMHGYDLFLDHMLNGPAWVYDLPQPVAFPYVRDPFIARQVCSGQKTDSVWFDKRFIMMLTHGSEAFHRAGFETTISFLENTLSVPVAYRHADYENVIGWGDPLDYMREMAGCSYYVNLIACGAGQGLCDAASLGLICFGSARLPYHKAICHPVCLCRDLSELEWKLAMVRSSADLQQEIRSWQDVALSDMMVTQPVRILQAAVAMKRARTSSVATDSTLASHIITELKVEELSGEVARINSTKLKQRAQSEYEKGNYEGAGHCCRQALWFDKSDHELFYLMALASYAVKDVKQSLSSVAECLKLRERYQPAITLQSLLLREKPVDNASELNCRARIMHLIYNRFDGYDKELDGRHLVHYNAILDELLHEYIRQGDSNNQLLIQHHKTRLNQLAAL
ncbi:MAG: hypothetical protein A2X80_06620 [Geobacteraceae bacterium GWB2_52_12]|nr:MAG: hypothetical protein A2X80_06620 [Geobacteraceae bacterium GWB2_52_12]